MKLGETESLLWAEAQASATGGTTHVQEMDEINLPLIPGHWCFTNESWKEHDLFLGRGWYSTLPGFEGNEDG